MARGGIEPPTRGFSERRGPIRLESSRVVNGTLEIVYAFSSIDRARPKSVQIV